MYFFGINHFIIYHEYDDLDFVAIPFINPSIKMNFVASNSYGNDVYKTDISFTGNPNQLFSFNFGYLIDVSSDCPTTG